MIDEINKSKSNRELVIALQKENRKNTIRSVVIWWKFVNIVLSGFNIMVTSIQFDSTKQIVYIYLIHYMHMYVYRVKANFGNSDS